MDAAALTDDDRVHEGGDNQVWFIDDDLVLRIKTDDESGKRQSRELLARDLVRKNCTNPTIIPQCVAQGRRREGSIAFCLESKIQGVSLEDISANAATEDDLARLLLALKAVNIDAPELADLEIEDEFDASNLEEEAREAWKRLLAYNQLHLDDENPPILNLPALGGNLRSHGHPPILLHADIKGEHILIDDDTGSVVGILDWTDVQIGHPATDIAGLAISLGSDKAARIGLLAGYSGSVVTRAIFQARCEAVILLDERLNGDDDSPVHLLQRQLQRALDPTPFG